MKKKAYITLFLVVYLAVICWAVYKLVRDKKNEEPHIYHLEKTLETDIYVYTNFKDNYKHIKYLFDLASEHPGTIDVLTNRNDIAIEDSIAYYTDSYKKNQAFFFNRSQSPYPAYSFVRVAESADADIPFEIKETISRNSAQKKRLIGDFEEININIVQQFLNYANNSDKELRQNSETYTYELCNKHNTLIMKRKSMEHGKYYSIEMY